MRFHFDFGNWARMLRLAAGEQIVAVRVYYLALLLVAVPIAASFHAICFFLDGILFPGLHAVEVRKPVFVVGHARSGTTLVHRLMSRDSERFSAFMLYELYWPSLLQKRSIRAVAALDARFLGGALEKHVRAWEEKRYAATRKVHEMGLTQYEEDDIVFYWSCASGFWITKMPYMGDLDFFYVDRWPEKKRRRLMRFYRDCIKRQLYLNGTDKTHLSKNPLFCGRVGALIEEFPDARIVVPMRNPYETIPSLLKLVRSGWKRLGWPQERQQRCLRVLAEQSFDTYHQPLEVLAKHPETPAAVIDYRELTSDPAGALSKAYVELGLEMTSEFHAQLAAQARDSGKHVSGHSYSLEEFGLDAGEIRNRLDDLFERYRWEEA